MCKTLKDSSRTKNAELVCVSEHLHETMTALWCHWHREIESEIHTTPHKVSGNWESSMQKKAILNLNRRDKPVSQTAWVIFFDSSRHSALAIDKSEPSNSLLDRDNLSDLPPSHVQLRLGYHSTSSRKVERVIFPLIFLWRHIQVIRSSQDVA